jgi:Nitrile hydratase, alpha chain
MHRTLQRAILYLWERAATKGERAMTEAAGGGISRAEFERGLIQRSMQDETFRRRLLDDPKGTLERELGSALPEGVEVRVVEESADTIYLVLPPGRSADVQAGELSDRELDTVAGGLFEGNNVQVPLNVEGDIEGNSSLNLGLLDPSCGSG